jgi:DNA-binding NarL/FixJ family response regulator
VVSESDEFRLALAIALREEPGFSVVGALSTLEAVVGVASASPCDVVVIDRPGPGLGDVVERLRGLAPVPRVILRTDRPVEERVQPDGVVPLDADPETLMELLRAM